MGETASSLEVRIPGGVRAVDIDEAVDLIQSSQFVHWYDALPAGDPDRIDPLDLAFPAFLGAVPDFKALLQDLGWETLSAKLDAASAALAAISKKDALAEWSETSERHAELLAVYRACLGGDNANLPEFGPARCTKLLHKKRPLLIPIIDSYMLVAWDYSDPARRWRSEDMVELTFRLGEYLRANAAFLKSLRARLVGDPLVGALSDVRLYDIITYRLTVGAEAVE